LIAKAAATHDHRFPKWGSTEGTMVSVHRSSAAFAAAMLAIAMAAGPPTAANAQSQADVAQIMGTIKRLEARVAALEGENKEAKRQVASARAEAQALRQKFGMTAPLAAPRAASLPTGPYAMATKSAPLPPPPPSWSGLYAGAAFGAGWMGGWVDASGTSTSRQIVDSGFFSFDDTSTTTSNSSLKGRNVGAIGNLVVGYNVMATHALILGGQVEGGVSNIRVNLNGSGTAINTTTDITTPPGGPAGTATITSIQNFTAAATLDSRWLISVLGRGGVLVDPQDLVYLIGGYTYGRFEAFDQTFGLNGATIGAGWEREVATGWTLRGEYRYTKFQSRDVTSMSASASTGTLPLGDTITSSSTITATERVSADMHSVWLGVTHYFGR
jgi:opacity protein-like surface antigen